MRIRPQVTLEQRRAIQDAQVRMLQPAVALEIVRSCLRPDFRPEVVTCTLQSAHRDRFVTRVRVRSAAGEEWSYALKVFADDFGEQMWALARRLGEEEPSNHHGLCLPRHYVSTERALVFPWVDGIRLSEIVDLRKPDLLRRAAALAAEIHRTREAAVPELTLGRVLEETLDRCERLVHGWPSLETTARPLARLAEGLAGELDASRPVLIHGDMAAGQFLWTGDRLVLLDLDTACRGDPAYDVGHFLGQLERRCAVDDHLPEHSREWVATFREAYAAENPQVSWRNVSYYQGVTLLRKMHTLCRRHPSEGPRMATRLAVRAHAAFEAVVRSDDRRSA